MLHTSFYCVKNKVCFIPADFTTTLKSGSYKIGKDITLNCAAPEGASIKWKYSNDGKIKVDMATDKKLFAIATESEEQGNSFLSCI